MNHYRKRISEMEILQQTTFRQLNLEVDKKPEEQDKKYILSLMDAIRQTNIHLSQMGMGMPILGKMREFIQGGTYNNSILELNGIRENPLPSTIEYNNEAEKKNTEEQESEGEKEYQRQLKKAVF